MKIAVFIVRSLTLVDRPGHEYACECGEYEDHPFIVLGESGHCRRANALKAIVGPFRQGPGELGSNVNKVLSNEVRLSLCSIYRKGCKMRMNKGGELLVRRAVISH